MLEAAAALSHDLTMNAPTLPFTLHPNALAAPPSGIVEVFDYGRDRPGLLPLWVGEGDLATPAFICEAASASLASGDTFYTHQAGIPPLRAAIADYLSALYARPIASNRIFVTSGGMHALCVAVTMIAGPGDEVLIPTPAWPNFRGVLAIAGAKPRDVPMHFGENGWRLDLDQLAAAITPNTKALMVNTPANPTGWTATHAEIAAILEMARRHDLWIVADEIYGRFRYSEHRAPSFRDLANDKDKLLFVQTFSKNWAMTGWRLGWLEAPAELGEVIVNLIQYSSSGSPVFAQKAAIAALAQGESFIVQQVEQSRRNRALLMEGLAGIKGMRLAPPDGAFYLFFGIEGMRDARELAFALVDEAGIGLAPGSAFGAGGEGFLRLCYLRKSEDVAEAVRRLSAFMQARR